MTDDAILVLKCVFGNIFRFFNSWYIPGTNVTPGTAAFGCLFLSVVFRFVGQALGILASSPGSGPADSASGYDRSSPDGLGGIPRLPGGRK